MDQTTLAQWFSTLGINSALAVLMFYFYRKDVNAYVDLWKGQSEQLILVVKENTAAITKLLERRIEDRREQKP